MKTTALVLLGLVAIVVIGGGVFFIRLMSGPVSLDFMRDRIQAQINSNLGGGLKVNLEGVMIERDATTGMPHFRLRNVELADAQGEVIARAPKAAIGVDGSELMSGAVVPKQIELIGPRIVARRTLGGGFKLGFDEHAVADNGKDATGKSNQETNLQQVAPETQGGTVIDFLSGVTPGSEEANSAMASLDAILVSDAVIQLVDEVNGTSWSIPKASLAFKRMPYGFTLFSEAKIASGGDPWRAEISASYRRERKSFAVSARVTDLVPANIADDIFALSKLAQVKLPLSGHVEMEVSEDAKIMNGSAEFTAAAGEVGLPGFIAEPIAVNEGLLRLDFDPKTGGVEISNSTLMIGGSPAQIGGRIVPIRQPDGRLDALKIEINARNLSLDPNSIVKDQIAIDRVDFAGVASVREARFDVEDAVIMAGNAGVRLHGTFTGGERSVGIKLAGRVRDVTAPILKRLWPPIIAPNSRKWVNTNILAGRITDGEFVINLPVDGLADGVQNKLIPNDAIAARFGLDGVTTTYFGGLPPITEASGEGTLGGDTFSLRLDKGVVRTPSGKKVDLSKGTLKMTALLAPMTPAEIHLEGEGSVPTFIEYLDLDPLNLVTKSGGKARDLTGDATVAVDLHLPLKQIVDRDDVKVSATAKLRNAGLKDALDGIDLNDGVIDLKITETSVRAEGTAKLNDIAAKVTWWRDGGADSPQNAIIETTLDAKQRDAIGAKVNDYVSGPVKVKVRAEGFRDEVQKIKVEADLSKASLRLAAIDWWRPPAPRTTANFEYTPGDGKAGRIDDLTIKGDGFLMKGQLAINGAGVMADAKFPTVVLNEDNRFGVVITQSSEATNVSINGVSFDARPMIRSLFANRPAPSGDEGSGKDKGKGKGVVIVDAVVDKVYAHRGEVVTGVAGSVVLRDGYVERATINGSFISGQPITIRVMPADDGGRDLRVGGRDAGSALRAANLYSKVAGGQIDFTAKLGAGADSTVRNGRLTLRDFEVRDEAALAELDQKGRPKKAGPRKGGVIFSRLTLPFTSDARFIRIGDTLVKGPELGATAQGLIRKTDGAIDIDGTIIPVYALNSAIGEIPILGQILTGGKGEGIFGLTYAVGGTMSQPRFQVNPVSAIAPGILRKFFEYGGSNEPAVKRRERNN
ncbi:hypothetical protein G5V57_25265 [Nordella sp. HKS 07]|uniref:YhdP family protein n=1 Tax=Nordella sp. HKS 07 TaxID=2712222 RepID=UPI0013E14708|nr:DUF3971 domain-containing protein [Nordella sp. HKS 07]QIG50750.1 hypothetical protein G5V57_25265 [Nordella sp. HKS 07]